MLPGKAIATNRLILVADHLKKIQHQLEENAPYHQLMRELSSANQALTSIRVDFIKCNLEECLAILQSCQDNETQMSELVKLTKLFRVA